MFQDFIFFSVLRGYLINGFEKARLQPNRSVLKVLAMGAILVGSSLHLNASQVQRDEATIRSIQVTGGAHDLSVAITATVPLTPRIETVGDPDRLIVDLPEVLPRAGFEKILVNRGKLKAVRVALLDANPRITRVVLDLMGLTTPYRLLTMGNKLVVKLGDESAPTAPPIAATAKLPVETRLAETPPLLVTAPLTQSPLDQSPERSRARLIFPILFTATVLAMLVVSVVAHFQNKRGRRGV